MTNLALILVSAGFVTATGVAWTQRRAARRAQETASAERERNRELQARLVAVERRRSDLEAVLASMEEGVLAIDGEERVISVNRAAARMLSLDPQHAAGRTLQELVRHPGLSSLVSEALGAPTPRPAAAEVTLRLSPGHSADDRSFRAHAEPVRDPAGGRLGAVVVLHDVTRLRRLESVRRDFVANVSHEIKTPISAIKAAVETLIEDPAMPADPRQNFTGIIARQADRLDAIVEDLLSLARLEQEGDATPEDLAGHPVAPSVALAVETCAAKALAKSITLESDADGVWARVIPTLLEQAMVNLIDNAIKYSPERTTVRIEAEARGDEVELRVIDRGRGIEPEHLPRVFERFYRTDRARSRQLGGTGLGLSIVRHIAESLGGRVSARSTPGVGSTFRLTFRAAEPAADAA
ncbi:MAG: ATP-binding protein [Planctomycetota bacterium]